MAKYSIEDTTLTNIADAIRSKTGDDATLKPGDMPTAIEGIETGGGDISEYFKTSGFINPSNYGPVLHDQCVIKLPNELDTSNLTTFAYAFKYCESFNIPKMDTSNGTSFSEMFYYCSNIKAIPQIDTSKGTNFADMFGYCENLETVPQLNTSNGSGSAFSNMFQKCKKLTTIPQIDTSKGTNFTRMFDGSGVVSIPQIDTSNGTNFYCMFNDCRQLTTIPQIDTSKGANFGNFLLNATSLENLGGFKDLGKSYTQKSANYSNYGLGLSSCPKLTHDSLMNIINNLYDLNLTYDVANGGTLYTQKLTLGATNLAKLTAEEIAIATDKGWTVS